MKRCWYKQEMKNEWKTEEAMNERFRPRLKWVAYFNRWLIQVHPDVIEVMNDRAEHMCQVRWINDKMDYTQGGLPLDALREMFEKALSDCA